MNTDENYVYVALGAGDVTGTPKALAVDYDGAVFVITDDSEPDLPIAEPLTMQDENYVPISLAEGASTGEALPINTSLSGVLITKSV